MDHRPPNSSSTEFFADSTARSPRESNRPLFSYTAKSRPKNKSTPKDSSLSWYLQQINNIPLLTREEENKYATLAQNNNEEAKNKLIQANLRFVVSIAKKYQSSGLSLLDLINEGNLGLIKAAERFNPDRGYHFISYAVWWIRQTIILAINQKSSLIRLPLNRMAELRNIDKLERYLEAKLGREPSAEELAEELAMPQSEIKSLRNATIDYLSLDASYGDKEDTCFADIIEDKGGISPDSNVMEHELRNSVFETLADLSPNERKVIIIRYGLDGEAPRSLQSIGAEFNLSKERIRQIEKKALRKLKNPATTWHLDNFL